MSTVEIQELGGTAPREPYDLENVGRISMVVDPTAATFGLLEPSPR
jgi:predicted enzyme related to lactoylglutathione lyase